MTDPITTPAQMREADYCPFCGGMTETDFYQPYRSIGGKLGKACAIYCLDCSANMTICHEDRPGVDPEHLMSALVTEWNRRALPVAEPAPVAVRIKPLVWELEEGRPEDSPEWVAEIDGKRYEIFMALMGKPGFIALGEFYHTEAEAKAAAEADHAARILSQIDAVPAAQVRAEALEEAAAKFSGLAVLRKMWSASEVEAAIRALIEKGQT